MDCAIHQEREVEFLWEKKEKKSLYLTEEES